MADYAIKTCTLCATGELVYVGEIYAGHIRPLTTYIRSGGRAAEFSGHCPEGRHGYGTRVVAPYRSAARLKAVKRLLRTL